MAKFKSSVKQRKIWRKAGRKYSRSVKGRKTKKEYVAKNRKRINEYLTLYNKKETAQKYRKNYYLQNKKKIDKRNKLYQENHPEGKRIAHKKWRDNNPAITAWGGIKGRCKKKRIKLQMSKSEFLKWYLKQIRICVYCNISEIEWNQTKDSLVKKFKHLHVDRKDSTKGYLISNLVLACPRCNLTKSDFFTYEQMLKLGGLVCETRQHI